VICDQIVTCTTTCGEEELERAKNMLKSSLLMALESQLVQAEDMGRQIMRNGKLLDVDEVCRRIEMVTTSDVVRVGQRIFLGKDLKSRFGFLINAKI
jgi:predicted Zn-dependent peptidase